MPDDIRAGLPRTNLDENPSTWEQPTPEQDVLRQPGTKEMPGRSYRVQVRDQGEFANFRIEDLDGRAHVQRLAGQRGGGWDTVALLIDKSDAHVEDGRLVGDTELARDVLDGLAGRPVHTGGNRFVAHPRGRGALRRTAHEAKRRIMDRQRQREAGRGQRK